MTGRIVYDVWGGPGSMIHVARYLHDGITPLVVEELKTDIARGFLVNMRALDTVGVAWGEGVSFDHRPKGLVQ